MKIVSTSVPSLAAAGKKHNGASRIQDRGNGTSGNERGLLTVIPEIDEDMWELLNLIEEEDVITSSTYRQECSIVTLEGFNSIFHKH